METSVPAAPLPSELRNCCSKVILCQKTACSRTPLYRDRAGNVQRRANGSFRAATTNQQSRKEGTVDRPQLPRSLSQPTVLRGDLS